MELACNLNRKIQ